ncbi:hypothetical protein PNI0010_00123 [Streptococcus pneumoniae PNI0010]|nr:hypothetical protein PNI0006_02313 [Streptococcus pneumoniae PNI0006]ELU77792.1 hypothetical protein PNI0010_00123 [Streptococcus pneumoniae PNI0010]
MSLQNNSFKIVSSIITKKSYFSLASLYNFDKSILKEKDTLTL